MNYWLNLIPFFSGPQTWIGVFCLVICLFLYLFKDIIIKLLNKFKLKQKHSFIILILIIILSFIFAVIALFFAFLSARQSQTMHDQKIAQMEYEKFYKEYTNNINSCIEDKKKDVSSRILKSFSSSSSRVRCAGGGCLPWERCPVEQISVNYSAESGYYITEARIVEISSNHGNLGNLRPISRDSKGRPIEYTADISCDPPDYPGAPGGWAKARIEGTMRLANAQELLDEIPEICRKQFPKPHPPTEPRS